MKTHEQLYTIFLTFPNTKAL